MKKKFFLPTITFLFIFLANGLSAQWITDNDYKFKINVPGSWSRSSYMDGSDKVYDIYSPDENVAIQIRAFEAPEELSLNLLVNVYEEQMVPAGSINEGVVPMRSKTGIQGKQGTYRFDYNGIEVGMGVFYAIKNGYGYIVSALIPVSMLERKAYSVKQITETFELINNKPTGPDNIGALSGGAYMMSTFKINQIILCSQLNVNNNAVNPTTKFNSSTPEIHAVIQFTGNTNKDLTVSWIYTNWNRTITSDKYNFTDDRGIGVVSLSKPDNGWPAGNYKIVFELDGKLIDSKTFTVTGTSPIHNTISGKYYLESRSDGKSLVNYHYIFLQNDGSFTEKYQPKNSGSYIGSGQGKWKQNGEQITLYYNDNIVQHFTLQKDGKIVRISDDGVVFTFNKDR